MCDCYDEPCKICGKHIPMHLGDFKTDRFEIMAICSECSRNAENLRNFLKGFCRGFAIWKVKNKKITILYLTENAWRNMDINHPNFEDVKLVYAVGPDEGDYHE
ncbi:MAG: hypothetical protein QXX41_07940 [Nitrososphaerota archaeon]